MILRARFTKEGYLKYISHLDLIRLFRRAFKRGGIPLQYSKGYNPQAKFSIANPLPLGIESIDEYIDIQLDNRIAADDFVQIMNKELPEGIRIINAKYADDNRPINSLIGWGHYEIMLESDKSIDIQGIQHLMEQWLKEDNIVIERIKYKGKKSIIERKDIRPLIGNVIIKQTIDGQNSNGSIIIIIECLLKVGDSGNLRPTDFINAFKNYINGRAEIYLISIKRLKLFAVKKDRIISPM